MAEELSNINELKNLTESQFKALNNLSDTLNSCSHGESLIENVIDILIEVTNAERGLFATYNHENFDFSIISARNIEKESISDLSSFSSGVLQQVVNNNKPVLYHDVQSNPQISQFESVQLHSIKSVLGVPVRKNDIIWGVILVDSKRDRKEFTDKNLSLIHI
jgi:GAF domain-containing protein